MNRTLLLPCLVATVLVPLNGCTHAPAAAGVQAEEQRVLATEDEYVAAEISRDDATLRRIVDDRFQFNSVNGTTTGKDALISNVFGMNMVDQTITERSVLIDGDIALVFGTAELRFAAAGKEDWSSTLRYTATYVKRDGQWRMLALQMQRRAPD